MKLDKGDTKFLRKALPKFEIDEVRVFWDDSEKTYPDIWCKGKNIYVTEEWASQSAAERRKRLTHELIHIGWGLNHGKYDGLRYDTHPEKDEFSWAVYNRIKR